MPNTALIRKITDEEIKTYQEDGVICLRGLFSSDWIEMLKSAAETSMQSPGELHAELASLRKEKGRFFHDTFIWLYNNSCKDFVFNSPAAQIAADVMSSKKTNIFFDQWLIKEPGTETKTPWHHDMTYWPINGNQVCTLWLALDHVIAENGAVEYIKGSHKWGQKFKPVSFSGGNQYKEALPKIPDIESMRDQLNFVQFDMEPGDCTLHHGLIIHGSAGNESLKNRRRAHVSRWTGDDVTFNFREGLQELPTLPKINNGAPLDSELWPRIIG